MEVTALYNEKTIFAKWAADMYDSDIGETETDDVDFLLSLMDEKPRNILEVCCGSGRMLVPLAKAGHKVSGFDADEFMLAKIPDKAKGLENIGWHKADAVSSDWGDGFGLVVLGANILYSITSDMDYAKAQELFIKKAAAALVPGGYVFIDYRPGGHFVTQNELSTSKSGDSLTIWEGTDSDGNYGRMVLTDLCYDAATGYDSFTRRFELTLKSGETITQDIPSKKHFALLGQLHEWLEKAGFAIEQEYDGYTKNPISNETERAVIYARKL